jgi:hypothetical protein
MTSSCLDEEVEEDEEDGIVRGAWRFKVVKQPCNTMSVRHGYRDWMTMSELAVPLDGACLPSFQL